MTLIDDLRNAIVESHVPYAMLGKAAGISPSVIFHFINDDRVVRLDTAIAIVEALGMEIVLRKKERRAKIHRAFAATTTPGTINRNSQEVLGEAGRPGNTPGQKAYKMQCLNCRFRYLANGADVWQRKCPKCQGGRSGI